ncbi:MAG: PilT/PilU family type 4a pilus ATPase [Planctomycetes bacterium]|nr:PilT/PilU family type 4a pilus ATPase [Phycisphaerae bacterium]NBB96110.1 PilT/PilU family type 4a pilus ATPase [Planctomycetota bacterium]
MSEPTPPPARDAAPPLDAGHQGNEREIPTKLQTYFELMAKVGASDLHIKTDSVTHVRVKSQMRPVKEEPLPRQQVEEMADSLLTSGQRSYFVHHGQVDIAHEEPGGDRFRINIFLQRGEPSIAVRRVTRNIPNFEQLHLPPVLEKVTQASGGLVLLAGPTGCGKSTTIASMIEYINTQRRCHIVTIEDPIEYLYEDKKALISQREIGIDVQSFQDALRSLLREDPDIVLIGEMRDRDTFEAALQASETGHLVFGTVHASTAPQTVSRILDMFPPESRDNIMQSFAYNLQAIICQKLLPSVADGIDRVPAVEILLSTATVRGLLEDGRDADLADVIRSGEGDGMQCFSRSLFDLIEKDLIDPKAAYSVAPNAEELRMMMKGISQAKTGLVNRQM